MTAESVGADCELGPAHRNCRLSPTHFLTGKTQSNHDI